MSLLLTVNKYMYARNKLFATKTMIKKRLKKVQQKTLRTPTYKELYAPNSCYICFECFYVTFHFDHVIDVDKSSVDVVGPFK